MYNMDPWQLQAFPLGSDSSMYHIPTLQCSGEERSPPEAPTHAQMYDSLFLICLILITCSFLNLLQEDGEIYW